VSTSEPDDLALHALCTPAVTANDALDVLVDALLEAGILHHDGDYPWSDALPEWSQPSFGYRRRAFQWARQRLAPMASPMQRLAEIVATVCGEHGLPHAVIGIVRPSLLRVHFLSAVDPFQLEVARAAIAGRLPSAIVVEATTRPE
jgi:hypothetical protein